MASINARTVTPAPRTHGGAPAVRIPAAEQLRRVVMACMLWEDSFYVDGRTHAELVKELVHKCSLADCAAIALEARNQMKLRHVPLLIVREMARHPQLSKSPRVVSDTLAEVIQRADELAEFVAIYWAEGKCPLSKQIKLGLAKAFQKFSEYDLAKYNRDKDVKLRDVLFLCHSKPADARGDRYTRDERASIRLNPEAVDLNLSEGEELYRKLVDDQLRTPDTWEVELSQSKDKLKSWRRLLSENKLGDLAFLRNLRNMLEVGITVEDLTKSGEYRRWGRVLPFRFLSAARMVSQLEPLLEHWMFQALEDTPKLKGHTVLLIDTSGSMKDALSAKSDLTRLDTAKALAMLLRELCESVEVYAFDTTVRLVPPRRGFALADAIGGAGGGTCLGAAVASVRGRADVGRLIVLTDEQSSDPVGTAPAPLSYMINVAAYRHGVGTGDSWLRINGFSEAIVSYIQAWEAQK